MESSMDSVSVVETDFLCLDNDFGGEYESNYCWKNMVQFDQLWKHITTNTQNNILRKHVLFESLVPRTFWMSS